MGLCIWRRSRGGIGSFWLELLWVSVRPGGPMRLLRSRCRDVPPAGQFLSLLRQRKEPKKGDPDVAPFAALRAHTEAGYALAGKLALLAIGQRCSNSFFSSSASAHPSLARHTGAEPTARCASPARASFAIRQSAARLAFTGSLRRKRQSFRAPSEPSSSAGPGGKRKTDCLSPQGEFEVFPARREQRRAVAPRATGEVGRLSFGDFPSAKQRKVTAPPGAHPGKRL